MQESPLLLLKLADFKDNPNAVQAARDKYHYQEKLTQKLEAHEGDFTETNLLEIALWKVNRYTDLSDNLLEDLNDLRRNYSEDKMKLLLAKMLHPKRTGFKLPMASTFLKFAAPKQCAIIDQRAYRFLTGELLKIPGEVDEQIDLYVKYLAQLKEKTGHYGITFEEADKVLYQLDKLQNKIHKLK